MSLTKKDIKLPQMRETLHSFLKYGKENAIQGKELAAMSGMSVRAVQRLVHDIRWKFEDVILSEPRKGYWLSNDREEIRAFIDMRDKENRRRYVTVQNIRKELLKDEQQMSMDLGNNLKGNETDVRSRDTEREPK